MKILKSVIICLVFILGVSSLATAAPLSQTPRTLYVKPRATGTFDCASWANACELQAALDIAVSGDKIWVAEGTYNPSKLTDTDDERSATFQLISDVAIYGGFPATGGVWETRDWVNNLTTLTGDIGIADVNTDNSYHVVTGSMYDSSAILDGFTISDGNANNRDDYIQYAGGGMVNLYSNPTVENVIFTGNYAERGGGMGNENSSPILKNVTFIENSAQNGGGMSNENGSPTLENVTFTENSASQSSGGMFNYTSSPTLTDVTFSTNSAKIYGGGMMNSNFSTPSLTNVSFIGNEAGESGGGMVNDYSSPLLNNVTFSSNYSGYGGGIYNNYFSNPVMKNVTFSGNTASSSSFGGAIYNYKSNPTLTNAIVWGNMPAQDQIFNGEPASIAVSYSDIQGWDSGGTGNINTNPQLSPLANNGGLTKTHALNAGSPAIGAGDPSTCLAADQRGHPRLIDGDGNASEICDIGAYEFGFTLAVVVLGEGLVEKSPDRPDYKIGDVVTLTAIPATGWEFQEWTGWETSAIYTHSTTVTISGNTSRRATFALENYTLSTTVNPVGSGTITRSSDQSSFNYNDTVDLTAYSAPGWSFSGWSGNAEGAANPLTVTIKGNTSITANWQQIIFRNYLPILVR